MLQPPSPPGSRRVLISDVTDKSSAGSTSPPPRARAALTPPRFPRPALALSRLRVYGSTHARFLVLMGVGGGMYGSFHVLWGCVLRIFGVGTCPGGVYVLKGYVRFFYVL